MSKNVNGWELSKRDGGNRFINDDYPNELIEKENERIKERLRKDFEIMGLPEELKKMYPEIFE